MLLENLSERSNLIFLLFIRRFPGNHFDHDSHSQMFKNISFEDILDLENSRYSNDFIELKLLGKGGFANVWQVSIYAILLFIGPNYYKSTIYLILSNFNIRPKIN